MYEEIPHDEDGIILPGRLWMTWCRPRWRRRHRETGHTVTPSPHHPLGAKGVGESATVGAPPAIANAVVDALARLGVTHIEIPSRPDRVQIGSGRRVVVIQVEGLWYESRKPALSV